VCGVGSGKPWLHPDALQVTSASCAPVVGARPGPSGRVGPVGEQEGVHSVLGVGLDGAVELVVDADHRQLVESVVVVGVGVSDLRPRGERRPFLEGAQPGPPDPAAAHDDGAFTASLEMASARCWWAGAKARYAAMAALSSSWCRAS
jgi:pimeloyl-ACP methyl ester carboxylesterase